MEAYSKEDFESYARSRGLYVLGRGDEDLFVECGVDAFLGYGMYNTFFGHTGTPDKHYKDMLALVMRLLFRGSPDAVTVADSKEVGGFAQILPPGFCGVPLMRYVAAGGWRLPFMKGGFSFIARSSKVEEYSFGRKRDISANDDIYLYNLAVRRDKRRQHIASSLVEAMTGYAGGIGRPCYLETYDPNNVRIYEAMGFCMMGDTKVPGSDLTHYPFMKRP